jgi:hypothetical protein
MGNMTLHVINAKETTVLLYVSYAKAPSVGIISYAERKYQTILKAPLK